MNPEALAIAQHKDAERGRQSCRPSIWHSNSRQGLIPHYGQTEINQWVCLLQALRYNYSCEPLTDGCSGLVDAIPKFESSTIKRLREQGAIILGKTVPTQWANYRNPGRASGRWSAVGGQCLGPYHEEQDPSGSSSGSAVAASLGLCAAALGTEVRLAMALSTLF